MLAPSRLPEPYLRWNHLHGAPHGRDVPFQGIKRRILSDAQMRRARGPFSLQENNTTRAFEYPWAFDVAGLQPGMQVLEVGGSLAGFQFVLARHGCQVVNVDPGMEAAGVGWPCDQRSIGQLNRIFGTNVELRNTTVDKAELPDAAFERAFCVSVIEHLPPGDAAAVMTHVFRCLKPGGLFILTLDLFLNVRPFCRREKNEYGVNQDVRELIGHQPWRMVAGRRDELCGFPEFNPDNILARLETFLVGYYPALAQCIVLQKPD